MNDYDKVPIKHSDILRNVINKAGRNTAQVMQLAGKMLKDVSIFFLPIFVFCYFFAISFVQAVFIFYAFL